MRLISRVSSPRTFSKETVRQLLQAVGSFRTRALRAIQNETEYISEVPLPGAGTGPDAYPVLVRLQTQVTQQVTAAVLKYEVAYLRCLIVKKRRRVEKLVAAIVESLAMPGAATCRNNHGNRKDGEV